MNVRYPMAIVVAPEKIEFQDRKLPALGTNDVIIKVKAASICGSDLHIYKGKHPSAPLPVAVGHEVSGEVVRIGEHVSSVALGDRVAVEPVIACGKCHFCLRGKYHLCTNISFQYRQGQGGFAPYFMANERWLHKLPENISYEEGALIEPLSVAIHAVTKGCVNIGQTGVIFGAGAIGLLILMVMKYAGVGDIFVVDIQEHRLEKAIALGASSVLNNLNTDAVEQIFKMTNRLGVDKAFEAVGIEATLVQSLEVLKKGGTAVLAGIFERPEVRIPANIFVQKEITLTGSQGYCWDFQEAVKFVEHSDVQLSQLITHVIPLGELHDGFELLMDPENKAIKVVIKVDR